MNFTYGYTTQILIMRILETCIIVFDACYILLRIFQETVSVSECNETMRLF